MLGAIWDKIKMHCWSSVDSYYIESQNSLLYFKKWYTRSLYSTATSSYGVDNGYGCLASSWEILNKFV
jgi:hypothetical protein